MNALHAIALGPTPYGEGLALQESLVRMRAAGETGDWLLFPDHPRVITIGRGASGEGLRVPETTLAARGIERFEVSRGGDITWHGPGQLVAYPIVDLSRLDRDLHVFLRHLEGALIETLRHWEIESHRVEGRTGVWAGEEKIASIGIAVRRWVSYHGVALNVMPDLGDFDLMHPCGLKGVRMTSMAERLGDRTPELAEVRERFAALLAGRLGYDEIVWAALPKTMMPEAASVASRRERIGEART